LNAPPVTHSKGQTSLRPIGPHAKAPEEPLLPGSKDCVPVVGKMFTSKTGNHMPAAPFLPNQPGHQPFFKRFNGGPWRIGRM